MKNNVLGYGGSSVLALILIALAFFVVKPALAQEEATSTDLISESSTVVDAVDATSSPTTETTTNTIPAEETASPSEQTEVTSDAEATTTDPAAESTTIDTIDSSSASTTDTTSSEQTASTTSEQTEMTSEPEATSDDTETAPAGLTEVHIIGTKYIDYFTDGSTIYTFPGDPEIHAHIAEKDAPIPTHEALAWVHSTGHYLYDTASGDLEVGQYAIQSDGSVIANQPPFVSSTSTPAITTPSSDDSNSSLSPEILDASTSSDVSSTTADASSSISITEMTTADSTDDAIVETTSSAEPATAPPSEE
jgi:hypothetical protein